MTSGSLIALSWLALVVAAVPFRPFDETAPVVTKQGELVGAVRTTEAGTQYSSYQGIPYAKPPLGYLRFRAPEPPLPWMGVRKATSEGLQCCQPTAQRASLRASLQASLQASLRASLRDNQWASLRASLLTSFRTSSRASREVVRDANSTATGTGEDCLFINVYVPGTRKGLLPILFYIHGGGFVGGSGDSSSVGPDYLMDRGQVVLVSINYRLGPFGFLSTGTSDAPGNSGLKDQLMALHWVRENIEAFGGDPQRVTIYGDSAGSVSTHMHVLAPASAGLFHAAIMASGVAQEFWATEKDAPKRSERLAKELGAHPSIVADPRKRVQFLRQARAQDIVNAVLVETVVEVFLGHYVTVPVDWPPVVEPHHSDEKPFLSKPPNDILRSNMYNKVPMIIGGNSKEGSLLYTGRPEELILFRANLDFVSVLPTDLFDAIDAKESKLTSRRIKEFYFQDRPVDRDSIGDLINLFGDHAVTHGVHLSTRWHVNQSTSANPVYIFNFDKRNLDVLSVRTTQGVPRVLNGSAHAEEKAYVLTDNALPVESIRNPDGFRRGVAQMVEIVSNFVSYGNPTPNKTETVNVHWPKAQPGIEQYLDIQEELVVKQHLFKDRMSLWDELYRKYLNDPIYQI